MNDAKFDVYTPSSFEGVKAKGVTFICTCKALFYSIVIYVYIVYTDCYFNEFIVSLYYLWLGTTVLRVYVTVSQSEGSLCSGFEP